MGATYSSELATLLLEHLEELGYGCFFDEDEGMIDFSYLSHGRISGVQATLEISEVGFALFVNCPLQADPMNSDQLEKVSEFLHLVNYHLVLSGNFELNMDNGFIRFRNYADSSNGIPDSDTIGFIISQAFSCFDMASEGIVEMLYTDKDPQEALNEILAHSQEAKQVLDGFLALDEISKKEDLEAEEKSESEEFRFLA